MAQGCSSDGKSGDGAGIQIEIAPEFFKEKILSTGHTFDEKNVEWFFQEQITLNKKSVEIIESALLAENYYIYGWRQVPINPSVLGKTADQNRPEIAQVMFKNETLQTNDLERDLSKLEKSKKSQEINK